jgi:hypothetical protein
MNMAQEASQWWLCTSILTKEINSGSVSYDSSIEKHIALRMSGNSVTIPLNVDIGNAYTCKYTLQRRNVQSQPEISKRSKKPKNSFSLC